MIRQDFSKAGSLVKIYAWLIASLTTLLTKISLVWFILLLDFENAFDTLEWPFIEKKPYDTMASASRSKNGYKLFILFSKAA